MRVLSQPEIQRPNGLALTPDGKTLYVIDSNGRPGGNRKVWAFDVPRTASRPTGGKSSISAEGGARMLPRFFGQGVASGCPSQPTSRLVGLISTAVKTDT